MYASSSQKHHWTFANEDVLKQKRKICNKEFIAKFREYRTDSEVQAYFLSYTEERRILETYEVILMKFCNSFIPKLPENVVGTVFHYFKRFYLHNSVMEYHPKEMSMTCVYLACKIEEFNLTMPQFVNNIKEEPDKWTEIILNNELLLMETIKFHLIIHNPYIARDALLEDMKGRAQDHLQLVLDPTTLRPHIDHFLEIVLLTDIPLLYTQSQIAIAAILQAASKTKANIDTYVTDVIAPDKESLQKVIGCVKKIRRIVAQRLKLEKEGLPPIDRIEKKLELCRNPYNNPDSEMFRSRMVEELNEEDDD